MDDGGKEGVKTRWLMVRDVRRGDEEDMRGGGGRGREEEGEGRRGKRERGRGEGGRGMRRR